MEAIDPNEEKPEPGCWCPRCEYLGGPLQGPLPGMSDGRLLELISHFVESTSQLCLPVMVPYDRPHVRLLYVAGPNHRRRVRRQLKHAVRVLGRTKACLPPEQRRRVLRGIRFVVRPPLIFAELAERPFDTWTLLELLAWCDATKRGRRHGWHSDWLELRRAWVLN